jgi:hypothetical protein
MAKFRFEVWPSEHRVITQHFGMRPEVYAKFGLPGHEGIDIKAPVGGRIFCVAPGTVRAVHRDLQHPYGLHVRVDHDQKYQTIYAHLSATDLSDGQALAAGDLIGLAGETGNAVGAHLHLTLKRQGTTYRNYPNNIIDPTRFLMPLLDPNWDDATFVRDSVPDGTIVQPGASIEQTWWLHNSGASTWGEGYALARVGGEWPGAPERLPLPPAPPEAEVPVTVRLPIPPTPGVLHSEWWAVDAQGNNFGDLLWVTVEAVGSAAGARAVGGFVARRGRELVVGSQPLRFFGMNLRGIAHYGRRNSDPLRYSHVDHRRSQLQQVYDLGARAVRLFLADKDASVDEIVQRLRELLVIGKEFPGLYFLPAFTNLYNDVPFFPRGDERFFAPRGGRDLLTKEFFAGGYQEHYLPFVQRIVTEFASEPQILAWEIGNELKLDRADPNNANDVNPQIFVNFMHEIARQIKRLDANHLVTTGMKSTQHAWMEGSPLRDELYGSPNIDFLTIHSYEGMFDQDGDAKVYDDIGLATRLNKPFVVEEAGFDVRIFPGQRVEKHRQHMERWYDAGASGYMPWGFIHAREIGDGDQDVGVGVNQEDFHDLCALFRSQAQRLLSGTRGLDGGAGLRGLQPTSRGLIGWDFRIHTQRFLAQPSADPLREVQAYEVRLERATAGQAGETWQIIGVHHLRPEENKGQNHIFVEVLDANGARMRNPNLRVAWGWEGQRPDEPSSPFPPDKGDGEPAGNLPLGAGQRAWLRIEGDGQPSDRVSNLHTGHPAELGPNGELWNSMHHHSFYVVFQRRALQATTPAPGSGGASTEPTTPTPGSGAGADPTTPAPHPGVGTTPAQPLTGLVRRRVRAAEKIGIDANAPISVETGRLHPQVADPAIIADSGAGWVRINFILGRQWQDPTDMARPHGLTWQETYRRIFDGYHARGMKIYGLISDEAMREPLEGRFRQPPGADALNDSWLRRYTETFVTIARMFADRMQYVETFNEPDDWKAHIPGHSEATRNWVHPGWYAVLHESIYTAVRAIPELAHLTVISGPLQGLEGENKGNGARGYLDRAYQEGIARFGWGRNGKPFPFDGVGYHLYVHERHTTDVAGQQAQIRATYRRYIDEMEEVIRRHEGREKLLFISEMGWFTNGGNREAMEQFQAASLPFALRCLAEDSAVGLVVNFCTQDFDPPGNNKYYGIYREGALDAGNRKPVFAAFQRLCQTELELPVLAVGGAVSPIDDARFVRDSDLLKDGTPMTPGQRFTQRWQVRNTGTTTWGEGYRLVWVDRSLGAPPAIPLPPTAPDAVATITIEHMTPETPGLLRSTWRLCNPQDQFFGEELWTEIDVQATPAPGARGLQPVTSRPPGVQPAPTGAAQDQITAAALGVIYTGYWLQVLQLPPGPEAEAAIARITAATVAQVQNLAGANRP